MRCGDPPCRGTTLEEHSPQGIWAGAMGTPSVSQAVVTLGVGQLLLPWLESPVRVDSADGPRLKPCASQKAHLRGARISRIGRGGLTLGRSLPPPYGGVR